MSNIHEFADAERSARSGLKPPCSSNIDDDVLLPKHVLEEVICCVEAMLPPMLVLVEKAPTPELRRDCARVLMSAARVAGMARQNYSWRFHSVEIATAKKVRKV